jgi:very-short-patch-repair endonuclease
VVELLRVNNLGRTRPLNPPQGDLNKPEESSGNHSVRYKDIPGYVTELARANRLKMTNAEQILWTHISNKKLNGLKFRRQYPIGRYIADFYNHDHHLIIEVDGSIHDLQKEYDKNKSSILQGNDCSIIRFSNKEIYEDIESVKQTIISAIIS